MIVDDKTREMILHLFLKSHYTQSQVATALNLPVQLVADVLDAKR